MIYYLSPLGCKLHGGKIFHLFFFLFFPYYSVSLVFRILLGTLSAQK